MPRPRHGRRVGERRGAGRPRPGGARSRQGARPDAERVGDRLRRRGGGRQGSCCRGGAGGRCSSSACCRRCSRCGSAAASRSRRSGRRQQWPERRQRRRDRFLGAIVGAGRLGAHRRGHADERLHAVRLVGLQLWLPGYLSLPVAAGGIGLSTATMTGFVVAMQVGMWFGYVTFGYVGDSIGRRRAYVIYLLVAAALICVYASVRTPLPLLAARAVRRLLRDRLLHRLRRGDRGDLPHRVRATAQGLTYNSAASPAPPRRSRSARWRRRAGSPPRCRSPRPRSCWPPCSGSGSPKQKVAA